MSYKIISKEKMFTVRHAYAMSYFDKRGLLVKKLKRHLPYIDISTDKDQKVMMSSSNDTSKELIQGFFTPDRFSMREINHEGETEVFYELAEDYYSTICDELGLDEYIDAITVKVVLSFEFEERKFVNQFLREHGFTVDKFNDSKRTLLDNEFNILYSTEIGEEKRGFCITFDEIKNNDNILYELELITVFVPANNEKISSNEFNVYFDTLFDELNNLGIVKKGE